MTANPTIVYYGVDAESVRVYRKQIQDFFGRHAQVEGYTIDRLTARSDADLIVVSSELVRDIVMSGLGSRNGAKIVVLKSVFSTAQLATIKGLARQKALIVSLYRTYVKESIRLIEASLKQKMDFIPYYENVKHKVYDTYTTAIYIGEDRLVPHGVKTAVNVGWRKVSHYTLMQIIEALGMSGAALDEKLARYRQGMPDLSFERLQAIQLKSETTKTFDGLFDAISDRGIVLLDHEQAIMDYNEYVCDLFDIRRDVYIHRKIRDTSLFGELHTVISTMEDNVPLEMTIRGLDVTIERRTIRFQHLAYQTLIFIEKRNRPGPKPKSKAKYTFKDIISVSPAMGQVLDIAKKVAKVESPALIMGETGTGKELFAQALHNASPRRNKPFIALNCTTLQESLLTSELFGYEKGTFTGALDQGKKGIFEIADSGTVFLDEIGDAPLNVQLELLRVLEEKEIRRIGGEKMIPVNVRIISATNRDLYDNINQGRFRKDLYYRLSAFVIEIPALKERTEDIRLLTDLFLKDRGYFYKKISPEVYDSMERLTWEGNIRELKNFVHYMGYMSEEIITMDHIPVNYKRQLAGTTRSGTGDLPFPDLSVRACTIAMAVLKSLAYEPKGRAALAAGLSLPGLNLSEYDIRTALAALAGQGFVSAGRGRRGSSVTEKGLAFLAAQNRPK